MSTRKRMYLGTGDYDSGGYGGDEIGWLWKILGMDKTSGGPTVDPATGKVVFTPYQGDNFISRRVAAKQNQAILPDIYKMQQEGAQRMSEIEAQNKGRIQGEKVRGRQDRKNTRLQGVEARKTQAEGSSQRINETKVKQAADVLKEAGIIYDEKAVNDFTANVNPARGEIAANKAKLDLGLTKTPEFAEANRLGTLGFMMQPYYNAQRTGTTQVGRGDMAVVPDVLSPTARTLMLGATPGGQQMVETGGFTDPKTGMKFGGKMEVMNNPDIPGQVITPRSPQQIEASRRKFKAGQGISTGEEVMQQDTANPPLINLGVPSSRTVLPSFGDTAPQPPIPLGGTGNPLAAPFLNLGTNAPLSLQRNPMGKMVASGGLPPRTGNLQNLGLNALRGGGNAAMALMALLSNRSLSEQDYWPMLPLGDDQQ